MSTKEVSPIIRVLRIVLPIVGAIIAYFLMPWMVIWAWLLPLPDTVQEQVDEALTHGTEGVIVYVDQAGKPEGLYTAGWDNRQDKTAVNPNLLFKIGSITKLYVAVATAKLVNDKRLSLDKTLAEYFPELADRIQYADKITLRMMVQHRSGIPNYTDSLDYWNTSGRTSQQNLDLALDLPAYFEPDDNYGYSNTNYLLLSKLISQVVGYSHNQYIKESILMPLGLKNTFGSLDEVNIDNVMSGYYVNHEPDLKTSNYGLMLATAKDVGIFIRALNYGTVFKEGEQAIYHSIYELDHTGLLPGYQSVARYYPDIDTVIVQFANTTDFANYSLAVSSVVTDRIADILRKEY